MFDIKEAMCESKPVNADVVAAVNNSGIQERINRKLLSADSIHFRRNELLRCLDMIVNSVNMSANEMPIELIDRYNAWIQTGYNIVKEEGKLYSITDR